MQTIQELADNFYARYEEHGDGFGHSSNVYNTRLCEQVRELIEYHVTEALKAASEKVKTKQDWWQDNAYPDGFFYTVVDRDSVLTAYPLDLIK